MYRFITKLSLTGLVAVASIFVTAMWSPLLADIKIELDPFDETEHVLDSEWVWVVIYGSDHLDAKDIDRKSLRLAPLRDPVEGGQPAKPHQFLRGVIDLDDDGYMDSLVRFRIDKAGFNPYDHTTAVLSGIIKNGNIWESFEAVGGLSESGALGTSQQAGGLYGCILYSVSDPGKAAVSCYIDKSNYSGTFSVDLIRNSIEILFAVSIPDENILTVELWGGDGHKGADDYSRTDLQSCKGGSGGKRGYARTILTVGDLTAHDLLYLYLGKDGSSHSTGGSSTALLSNAINHINTSRDPKGEGVIAVAGGGGGGGKGHIFNRDDFPYTLKCQTGSDGGNGASAVSNTSSDEVVNGHGGDGGSGGQGGRLDHFADEGGVGHIGGYGGGKHGTSEFTRWEADFGPNNWGWGRGGVPGSNPNGSGGGGAGGGGAGETAGSKRRGGGGGGGSYAIQSTFSRSDASDFFDKHNPGRPALILTFEVNKF